jgi:hypothetical protein
VTTQRTITISNNSLSLDDRCNYAYWITKVLGRRAVRTMPGRIAGAALHDGIAAFFKGKSVAEQDAAIDAVFAADPTPPDDYRQAGFVRDALAHWRVERGALFASWKVEECEAQATVELGFVEPRLGPLSGQTVLVRWEVRRDLVAVNPDGMRYLVDWKSASRNEQAEYEASKNSGALMGYCRSYTIATGLPVHGAYLGRIIMRKPSKSGTSYEFPPDDAILFPADRLDQWQRHTLRKVRGILERDPQDLDDWPLASHVNGACRGVWGTCDFLPVCQLPLADRALKLSTDEFEPADAGKERDRIPERNTNGEP